MLAAFLVLVASVVAYHWQLARPHRRALLECLARHATQSEMAARYGPPLAERHAPEPCSVAGGWASWPEVREKCGAWPATRAYLVQSSEFIYVIYYDSGERMRDFTLIE